MAELEPLQGTSFYLWKYLPSIPAAAVFLTLFSVLTIGLCCRMVKTRTWFSIAFAIGGLFQVIGYSIRILSHFHTDQIAPYAIQTTFILLAPVFYAASIYMTLGRIIRSVHADALSIIRPSRLTKVFVLGDVLSLTVQGNAAGLTFKDNTRKIGEGVIIGGLFVQLLVFGLYIVAAVVFHRRMRQYLTNATSPAPSSPKLDAGAGVGALPSSSIPTFATVIPWRQGLGMLYACSVLIMARSIFRVIEYIMGGDGYLLSNEWPMYVFDSMLMLFVQGVYLGWYPDKFKVGLNSSDGYELETRQ